MSLPPYVRESLVMPSVSLKVKNKYLNLVLNSSVLTKAEKINKLLTSKTLKKREVTKQIEELNKESGAIKKKIWDLVNGNNYEESLNSYQQLYDQNKKATAELSEIIRTLKVMTKVIHPIPENVMKFGDQTIKSKPSDFKLHLVKRTYVNFEWN